MKRTYFLLILLMLFVCFTHKAHSQELDYAKSREYWVVDENQNPVISKVFNLPQNATKSDVYEAVMTFVAQNYAATNFKILYADSTKGKLIVNANYQLIYSTMSVWHSLIVESRGNKIKVSFTLNSFEKPYYFRPEYFSMTEFLSIATEYPINQDKPKRKQQEQAFLAAVQKSLDLLGNFERTLTKVVTAKNADW
ncbi:DUF4468 domain-containing protein [Flectobacillus sp. DC10W]|uniref:DUF4468 domain-containing protein n=1 Tax=Flectobacillus longus TaxID=2984207 RepID=A0ABT6YID7_9BACT|nr:DUF4468 domain-containing protein [Flectobacillus longus]MDI9863346.1 DUF4468 domain-containing protein [Flectobacillus longus]